MCVWVECWKKKIKKVGEKAISAENHKLCITDFSPRNRRQPSVGLSVPTIISEIPLNRRTWCRLRKAAALAHKTMSILISTAVELHERKADDAVLLRFLPRISVSTGIHTRRFRMPRHTSKDELIMNGYVSVTFEPHVLLLVEDQNPLVTVAAA